MKKNIIQRLPSYGKHLVELVDIILTKRPRHHAMFFQHSMKIEPRYGYKVQSHQKILEILQNNKNVYKEWIEKFSSVAAGLRQVSLDSPADKGEPYWMNGFVQGVDPVSLYAMPVLLQSKTYLEIGSGNSTKFVAKAKRDYNLDLRIVSIDPEPRSYIDNLCDEIKRYNLESIDAKIFSDLQENDIVMFDGSHCCFPNSDVTVFFLEILPLLPNGVFVYIDDIWWPNDYPPGQVELNYSEQYLLGLLILSRDPRYEIVLPCALLDFDRDLIVYRDKLFDSCMQDSRARAASNGFWFRVTNI